MTRGDLVLLTLNKYILAMINLLSANLRVKCDTNFIVELTNLGCLNSLGEVAQT